MVQAMPNIRWLGRVGCPYSLNTIPPDVRSADLALVHKHYGSLMMSRISEYNRADIRRGSPGLIDDIQALEDEPPRVWSLPLDRATTLAIYIAANLYVNGVTASPKSLDLYTLPASSYWASKADGCWILFHNFAKSSRTPMGEEEHSGCYGRSC